MGKGHSRKSSLHGAEVSDSLKGLPVELGLVRLGCRASLKFARADVRDCEIYPARTVLSTAPRFIRNNVAWQAHF